MADVLNSVNSENVDFLCVVKDDSCGLRISEKRQIEDFLSALEDLRRGSPRKASNGETVVSLIIEPQNLIIQARMVDGEDNVFGRMGTSNGNRFLTNDGYYRSVSLRNWIEEALIHGEKANSNS